MRSRNVRSPPLAGDQRRCPLVLRGSLLVLPRTGSPGHQRPFVRSAMSGRLTSVATAVTDTLPLPSLASCPVLCGE
jgi:hypothetical protein